MPARTGKTYSADLIRGANCPDDASHFDTSTAYAAINRFRLDDLHPYIYRTTTAARLAEDRHRPSRHEPVNTVREDPKRKGLLSPEPSALSTSPSTTETTGNLSTNLPSTSIRDLVIHGDDIVVGTTAVPSGFLTTSRLCASSTRVAMLPPSVAATHLPRPPQQQHRHSASAEEPGAESSDGHDRLC